MRSRATRACSNDVSAAGQSPASAWTIPMLVSSEASQSRAAIGAETRELERALVDGEALVRLDDQGDHVDRVDAQRVVADGRRGALGGLEVRSGGVGVAGGPQQSSLVRGRRGPPPARPRQRGGPGRRARRRTAPGGRAPGRPGSAGRTRSLPSASAAAARNRCSEEAGSSKSQRSRRPVTPPLWTTSPPWSPARRQAPPQVGLAGPAITRAASRSAARPPQRRGTPRGWCPAAAAVRRGR